MKVEFSWAEAALHTAPVKAPGQTNPFIGHACALKACCKKYKKGKRCKKCPN